MLQLQRQSSSSLNTTNLPNYHINKRTNISHLKNCLKKRKKIRSYTISESVELYCEINQSNLPIIPSPLNKETILNGNNSTKSINTYLHLSSSSSSKPDLNLIRRRRRRRSLSSESIELVRNINIQDKPTNTRGIQMQSSRLRLDIIPTLSNHQRRYTRNNNYH